MTDIVATNQFERDWKKYSKVAWSKEWLEIMECLQENKPMSKPRDNHKLSGDWQGFMECKVAPDILIIYKTENGFIRLHRIGSHSELFGHKNKNR